MPPQSWAVRRDPWRRPDEQATAPAAPVPFWSSVARGYEDGWETRRRNARAEATDAALWERHRDLERRLGRPVEMSQELAGVRPYEPTPFHDWLDRVTFDPERINAAILGRAAPGSAEEYEALIEAERAKNPALLEGVETRAQLAERLDRDFRETRARADAAAGSGLEGGFGGFVGQVGAAFSDPANIGVAIATGGWGAARPLLGRMAIQGAAAGGQELLDAPGRAQDAERFGGPEYGAGEAALDVVFAGFGGAGFEAVGAGASRLWRAGSRRLGASGDAGDRGVARALDRLFEDEAVIGQGPEFDGARDALDRGRLPAIEPDRDLDDLFGASSDNGGVLAGVSPTQPGSVPAGAASAGDLSAVDYRGRRIWAGRFDPMALEVDAERFQYKAEADAEGVTGRLRGIEQWDATASGKILVFEDLQGRQIVADGHQRRGLARGLIEQGWEGTQLDGFVMREADGWTPREVRVVAALKNIREGSGTIMDAAKLFRDAPGALRDRSLPVTGDFIHQARQLASLSDPAFRAVVNGLIPERYGAVLGEMAADRPELQGDLVALLQKGEPGSVDGARALVQEALLDDFIATEGIQGDLFGALPRESTVIARGKIREAVLSGLRRDARILAQLVRHAEAIEAGGNVLARSENEARLAVDRAAGELVSRLALRSGEIGQAFTEAAEAVTLRKAQPGAAAKGLIQRIRAAVEAGELNDMARAEVLNPRPPSEAAVAAGKAFDAPGGEGQKAQAVAKPEDAALEAAPAARAADDDAYAEGIPDKDLLEAFEAMLRTGMTERGDKLNADGIAWAQAERDRYAAKLASRPADAGARPPGFRRDNPGGDWLARKQAAADQEADGRTDPTGLNGRRLRGATTAAAGLESEMRLPVEVLRGLEGVNGERPVPGTPKYDQLAASVAEQGWQDPTAVMVMVNHRGEAFLAEGNTRVRIAAEQGVQSIRAEVHWRNGAEAVDGAFAPGRVAELDRAARAADAVPAERAPIEPPAAEDAPPAGLFDDLPNEEAGLSRAITHLNACAPGKG